MRVRLPLGRTLLFVCVFLFSVVALFPLRIAIDWLALDDRGLAAREANGSVWLGALSEAQFGSIALGDLQASLRTFPLILGRARVDLARDDDVNRFQGAASVSRHGFGIDDMTARLDLGSALAPLPIASLDLSDVSARFANGLCVSAEGLVKATVATEMAGMQLPGGLSGNARCQETALLLPLVSQAGTEAVTLKLFGDGRYEVDLLVRPLDDGTRDRLLATGFSLAPNGGYVLRTRGNF
jgi:general secretion pathway protein N